MIELVDVESDEDTYVPSEKDDEDEDESSSDPPSESDDDDVKKKSKTSKTSKPIVEPSKTKTGKKTKSSESKPQSPAP